MEKGVRKGEKGRTEGGRRGGTEGGCRRGRRPKERRGEIGEGLGETPQFGD